MIEEGPSYADFTGEERLPITAMYPVGPPPEDDEVPDLSTELEPAEDLVLEEPSPEPAPVRRRVYDEDLLTREGLNAFLAEQLTGPLKPDEKARFAEVIGKLNNLFGKGDIDLRRLPNEEIVEKWRVASTTLESLGYRIDFGTGKRVKGRPRKDAESASARPVKIGRSWRDERRPNRPSAASPPEVLAS